MKKKTLVLLLIFAAFTPVIKADNLTAFPGAEGYGKFTTGGRGGNVYYVTRLDDCSDNDLVEGTLRWALRSGDDTPRTVLFNVCGTIYLTSVLKLQHPNVTIAGQTAPGGGICIAGGNIYVCKPNVIIRHIRFRSGDVHHKNFSCLDIENTKNVIVDHCSLTWSMEECLTAYDTDSTTIQWCIIGEGLYHSYHSKGNRSYATQWGGEHSTMHHTLITNCHNRTPRFNGVRDESHIGEGKHDHDCQVTSEFANNVVYNWGKENAAYGGECTANKNMCAAGLHQLSYNHIYMLDNYYVPGPATSAIQGNGKCKFVVPSSNTTGNWYLDGNYVVQENNARNTDNYSNFLAQKIDSFQPLSLAAYETAEQAYTSVCTGAGASLPRYDEEDTRLLAEAYGTIAPLYAGNANPTWLGIIDSPNDITFQNPDSFLVGEEWVKYPSLALTEGESLITDTDQDGMPDTWETEKGLNPNDASDGNLCTLSSLTGYTNLEYFLNGGDGELAPAIPAYVGPVHPSDEPENPEPEALQNLFLRNVQKELRSGHVNIRFDSKLFEITGKKY